MSKKKEYERLPGKRLLSLGFVRHSLWLGPDHLLSTINRGYTEEYKRFYYRDIQAMVMNKTSLAAILNIVLGALCLIFGLMLLLGWRLWNWHEAVLISFIIFGVLLFLVFVINLLKGPTCNCYLRTAVHVESLPSLHRVRNAVKAMRILKTSVEATQGVLDEKELLAQPATGFENVVRLNAEASTIPGAAEKRTLKHYGGAFHSSLFGLLLFNGVLDLADIFYDSILFYFISVVVALGLVVLAIGSLIKQRHSDMIEGVKTIVWCTVAFICIATVIGSIYTVALAISNPYQARNEWQLIQSMSKTTPPLIAFYIFSSTVCFSLGFAGFYLLRKFRRNVRPSHFSETSNAL